MRKSALTPELRAQIIFSETVFPCFLCIKTCISVILYQFIQLCVCEHDYFH